MFALLGDMSSVRSRGHGNRLLASLLTLAFALGAAASPDLSCAPGESGACSSATASTLYQTTRALYPDLGDEALEDDADKLLSLVDDPSAANTTSANKTSANASANASGELLLGALNGLIKKNATSAPAASGEAADASDDAEGEGEAEGANEDSLGNGTAADVAGGAPSEEEQAELDASLDVAVGPTLNGTAPPELEDEDAFGEPQDNATEAAAGEDEGSAEGGGLDDADAVAKEGEAAAAPAASASTAAAPKEAKPFKVLRGIGIRNKPTEDDSARTGTDVNEGDVVDVTEIVPAPKSGEGHKYLKLADGRGWIFTHSHRDGSVIAQQMEEAAVGPAPAAAAGEASENDAGPAGEGEGESEGEGEGDAGSEGEGQNQDDDDTDMQDDTDAAEDPEMAEDLGVEGAEGPPINGSAVADAGIVEGDDADDLDGGVNSSTIPDADATANISMLARMDGLEIASAVRHLAILEVTGNDHNDQRIGEHVFDVDQHPNPNTTAANVSKNISKLTSFGNKSLANKTAPASITEKVADKTEPESLGEKVSAFFR